MARAANSCASGDERLTSAISGGMPSDFAIRTWVVALSVARLSTARAACAAVVFELRPASSHVISGGMPPSLAIATCHQRGRGVLVEPKSRA